MVSFTFFFHLFQLHSNFVTKRAESDVESKRGTDGKVCSLYSVTSSYLSIYTLLDSPKLCHCLFGELLHPLIKCSKVFLDSNKVFLHCLLDLGNHFRGGVWVKSHLNNQIRVHACVIHVQGTLQFVNTLLLTVIMKLQMK